MSAKPVTGTKSASVLPAAMWSAASLPIMALTIVTDAAAPSSSSAISSAWLKPGSSLSATMMTCLPFSGNQSAKCAFPAPIALQTAVPPIDSMASTSFSPSGT